MCHTNGDCQDDRSEQGLLWGPWKGLVKAGSQEHMALGPAAPLPGTGWRPLSAPGRRRCILGAAWDGCEEEAEAWDIKEPNTGA